MAIFNGIVVVAVVVAAVVAAVAAAVAVVVLLAVAKSNNRKSFESLVVGRFQDAAKVLFCSMVISHISRVKLQKIETTTATAEGTKTVRGRKRRTTVTTTAALHDHGNR